MKNFLKKYGLMILPALWLSLLFVNCYMQFSNWGLRSFHFVEPAVITILLLISIVLGIVARAKSINALAIIALAFIPLDMMIYGPSYLNRHLYPLLPLHIICKLMIIANMIFVFVSKKNKPVSNVGASYAYTPTQPVAPAASYQQPVAPATNNQQVTDMQAQIAAMKAEMERMRSEQAPSAPESQPTTNEPHITLSKSAEASPAQSVPQTPAAPIAQPAPVAPAQPAPVVPVSPVAPAQPVPVAPVPVSDPNSPCFVLVGKKGTTVISAQGIQYQNKDISFNASYAEIESFYKFGALHSILYQGKEYTLECKDQRQLDAAFAFGKQCWEAARANKPSIRTAVNDNEPVYKIETLSNILHVYATYCVLSAKKNAANLLLMNKFYNGEKKYYYVDLTSVQYRSPGKLTDGFMEFEYPGSRSGRNASSYTSENSITFGTQHAPLMEEIYHFIDNAIHTLKHKGQQQTAAPSSADELIKFKQLLDAGIISQEEFDAKKRQLLGL